MRFSGENSEQAKVIRGEEFATVGKDGFVTDDADAVGDPGG